MLVKMVQNEGYETLEAADGHTGIQIYRQHMPDLVITDLVMPGKEGLETIRELRQMNPDVAIMAVSGGGIVPPDIYLNLAKKLGADTTVEKPFVLKHMIRLIKKTLPLGCLP